MSLNEKRKKHTKKLHHHPNKINYAALVEVILPQLLMKHKVVGFQPFCSMEAKRRIIVTVSDIHERLLFCNKYFFRRVVLLTAYENTATKMYLVNGV